MVVVGVISDTHGLLRPEAVAALRGCHHILHAGDVGGPHVLKKLEQVASVYAIRGNVDTEPWAKAIPLTRTVELGGQKFYLIHNRSELKKLPSGVNAVIYGHSHQPLNEWVGDVLYLNPGSAGPRRFRLPVSLAKVRIEEGKLQPELIQLQV